MSLVSEVSLLNDLVSINSIFPDEHRLALFIESYLKRIGFSVQRHYISQNRFNILAERGSGTKSVLFYGHMDTVPAYGTWNSDPFRLTAQGDRLYGLGACDMKGGIAVLLDVLRANYGRKTRLLFCVDEENISAGAWRVFTDRKSWFKDVGLAVSVEPGDSPKYTGGADIITLGRRGRSVFGISITGRSAHGAKPQNGISAIDEAAKIVTNLRLFPLVTHNKTGSESVFVLNIEGRSTSLSVPDKAKMDLDMHLVPPDTTQKALVRLRAFIRNLQRRGILNPETKVEVRIKERETPYIQPYHTPENSPEIKKILRIISDTVGKPVLNYGTSVADDNIIANSLHIPICTIGPAGGNIHSCNEWVSERSLMQLSAVYKKILEE